MSNVYFSCNIIIFDSYQLSSQLPLTQNNKQNNNNIAKTQINIDCSKKSQFIINNNKNNENKLNFYKENNINLYNPFMNRDILFFPVIRLFGTTKSGQKCCVNIHGYFPYFYIGITKENYFNYNNKDTLQAFAILLENTFIEYKNEISKTKYFKNEEKDKENNNNIVFKEIEQVIHNITPVSKTNIYGYYNKETTFLKIECYNPSDIKDLMYVLNQGIVNNSFYQCYDAHISYSMNFFGDFHLFGMGSIKIKNFSVREGIAEKNYGIDYNKKFTIFQKNIQWEDTLKKEEEEEEKIINDLIKEEVTQDEIINFINKYNDYMIWDKKYIELMKIDIKYNNFNKSSSSPIEIDCTTNDIIIEKNEEEIIKEDNMNNNDNDKIDGNNDSFVDVNIGLHAYTSFLK